MRGHEEAVRLFVTPLSLVDRTYSESLEAVTSLTVEGGTADLRFHGIFM